MTPSLYIHIPFCKRKCVYCNFYSVVYNSDLAAPFIDILASQIKSINGPLHSVYIGGGTPSCLDRKSLEKLLSNLKNIPIKSGEFTMEVNPESLDEDKIKLFLDSGVNRLSIGVQSLDERKLKKLGRIHSAARAKEAVLLAAKRGFKNISIDLIFGVWGEDTEGWKKELDAAALLPVTHASCYELTYEKGTPLYSAVINKSVEPVSDDIASVMYETAIDVLSLRGFKQYEVSNFAKPGFESKHNIHYWENSHYYGLGPSAVSYIDGVRAKNVSDLKEYISRFNTGKPLIESKEKLSAVKSAKETAAVKIRTKDGIDFGWFKAKTGFDFMELEKSAIPKLLSDKLIKYKREGDLITGVCLKRSNSSAL